MAPCWVYEAGVPLLGICYGMQALATKLGGSVESAEHREFGYAEVTLNGSNQLLDGVASSQKKLKVWMSHGDRVDKLPDEFQVIASSVNAPLAGMADMTRNYYGLQFHPEVTHTENGQKIIEHFVHGVCACPSDWTPANIIEDHIDRIRAEVGSQSVLLGLSGGVDSSVVAALLHEAIGDQLTCIFVDNGLLRQNEAEQVVQTFREHMGIKLRHVDAREQFLEKLKDIDDPETKRIVIGETFIRVFERETSQSEGAEFLVQGTLYPDVIESAGTGNDAAVKIKSHHNVGGLPDDMQLRLIEPLRNLFKDEVRNVGRAMGISPEIIDRQPFPGPGLAIRVIGDITEEKRDILRRADSILQDELIRSGSASELWQSFAVLTNTRSVGVQGDFRTYGNVIALRCITAEDAMTADWAKLPYELLTAISNRITNEVPEVNRVVYDITSKPPGTLEWE